MFGGQQHPHMEVYNELEADECGTNNDVLEVGDGPIVESRYWCDESLVPFPPANRGYQRSHSFSAEINQSLTPFNIQMSVFSNRDRNI